MCLLVLLLVLLLLLLDESEAPILLVVTVPQLDLTLAGALIRKECQLLGTYDLFWRPVNFIS